MPKLLDLNCLGTPASTTMPFYPAHHAPLCLHQPRLPPPPQQRLQRRTLRHWTFFTRKVPAIDCRGTTRRCNAHTHHFSPCNVKHAGIDEATGLSTQQLRRRKKRADAAAAAEADAEAKAAREAQRAKRTRMLLVVALLALLVLVAVGVAAWLRQGSSSHSTPSVNADALAKLAQQLSAKDKQ